MNGSKPAWMSKSFWGSAGMVMTMIATAVKYDIGDGASLGLVISGLLSAGWAFYGRIKAIKKIA